MKDGNIGAYTSLFEEATDFLRGYKKVRTYDAEVDDYFYKNGAATTADTLFIKDTSVTDAVTFSQVIEEYPLYVRRLNKDGTPAKVPEGYNPMFKISTLEEYFSWLQNLGDEKLGGDRKYTVLPIDEDHFEINANTRAINIPASFKKNGVAVQGDDLAEVLYFKIDRYFDYMDLNNCEIYIQWETPKRADGTTIKSVSSAYIRDIASEPDKLIFGWALSDAITANAGNLKFSVRFLQWDTTESGEKILAYSFSTLTAQVLIQPSINFNPEEDEYKVDDVADRLFERLKNSQIAGGYAAAVPKFVVDLVENPQDNKLGYDLNPDTREFELLVQAFSSDAGSINYTWKRQDLNEDNTTTDTLIEIVPSTNVYVEADKHNMNKSYVYYTYVGNDHYTPLTVALTEQQLLDDDFKVYLKQSKCIADRDGVYWAHAENRITNSSKPKDSTKAAFLRPTPVNISTQPKGGTLGEDGYTLSVAASNTDGVLTYQWYRDPNHALNFGETPSIWGSEETQEAGLIEGATGSTLSVNEDGHYRVKVTNTRNLKSKYEFSENSRVTLPAQKPIFINQNVNNTFFRIDALSDDNCPTIELDPSVDSDGYTVTWYLDSDTLTEQPVVIDTKNYEPGITRMSFNPKNFTEKIIAESTDNDIDGIYYAIVTNNLNGDTATTDIPNESEKFKIN